jgi:hypothetical protein
VHPIRPHLAFLVGAAIAFSAPAARAQEQTRVEHDLLGEKRVPADA